MADQPEQPQAGADGQQQQQSQADSAAQQQHTTQGIDGKSFDADYVQKVRSEAASWRTKAQQAQKRLDDLERGQMSELEKLKADHEVITKERDTLRQEVRTAQVVNAAAKAGAIYPDAVARLVAPDHEDVDAALKDVRKQYPQMFRTSSADAGAGTINGRPPATNFSDIIRNAAGRG